MAGRSHVLIDSNAQPSKTATVMPRLDSAAATTRLASPAIVAASQRKRDTSFDMIHTKKRQLFNQVPGMMHLFIPSHVQFGAVRPLVPVHVHQIVLVHVLLAVHDDVFTDVQAVENLSFAFAH